MRAKRSARIGDTRGLDRRTRLRLYLDLDNYRQLSQIFPTLDDPVIRAMGPEERSRPRTT